MLYVRKSTGGVTQPFKLANHGGGGKQNFTRLQRFILDSDVVSIVHRGNQYHSDHAKDMLTLEKTRRHIYLNLSWDLPVRVFPCF